MPMSRARCYPLIGTLLPSRCVKKKDEMLGRKNGPTQLVALEPQRGTISVEVLDSLKEKKSSHHFQMVPSGMGYLDPLEESTWSKNIDSAASMFPPPTFPPTLDLDPWGEAFQDLSNWCHKPLRDIFSIMADGTKGSSCIVQDDELNTPEIGVPREFNFTSPTPTNVLKEDSSPCLFDGEGWEIPPPTLDLPQIISVEEKSFQTVKKEDSDNTQSKPADGFFVDEAWGLTVSHEEEIVSSHNQKETNLQEFVQNKESDHDMKTSVNMYELGVELGVKSMDFDNCESVAKESTTETVLNTAIKNGSLESLLGPDFNVKSLGNGIFSIDANQQQADTNLSLKNLLAGSSFHVNNGGEVRSFETPRVDKVENKVTDTIIPSKSQVISSVKTNTHLVFQTLGSKESFPAKGSGKFTFPVVNMNARVDKRNVTNSSILRMDVPIKMEEMESKAVNCKQSETVVPIEIAAKNLPSMSSESTMIIPDEREELSSGDVCVMKSQSTVREGTATKTNLKLNLATLLGTDEMISTPVVLEPFFKRDEPFDLLAYVFDDTPPFLLGSPDTIPPTSIDLADRIHTSCTAGATKVEPISTEEKPFSNDEKLLDNTTDDATVSVMVVKPFIIEKSLDGYRDVPQSQHMEVKEEEEDVLHQLPVSRNKGLGKLYHQQRKSDKKGFKAKKGERVRKVQETQKSLLAHSILESKITPNSLKLRIHKSELSVGQANSTKVLSSKKQVSSKKNLSEPEGKSLTRQTRGRPVKQSFPSTSTEDNIHSSNRSLQRKASSSSTVIDEPWSPPSKRSRQSSVDSECGKYRELRDRNNEASRKSRQNRKARDCDMKETARKLEKENQSLKIKADEMDRLVKKLREALLEAVVKTRKE